MKLKILLSIVAVVAVTFAVVQTSRIQGQTSRIQGLRERAAAAEQKRLDLLMEMLSSFKGDVMDVVGVNPEAAYRKAADAYQARDLIALRTALYSLPAFPDTKMPLRLAFDDSFLRTERLQDFTDAGVFERFAWVNTEVSMYYGRLYLRGRDFEILTCIEEFSFLRFRKYKEKFHAEGKKDLEQVAQRFMDLWIAHIESPEGFTRIGLRGLVRQRTELAEAVRPGGGVSQKAVIEFGRGMARGLVRCGYTPKWLDVDFPPLPEEKESKGAEASNNTGH